MKKIVEEFKKKQIDTTLIERRLTARLQAAAKELTKTKKAWNNSTMKVISRAQIIEVLEKLIETISDEIDRSPVTVDMMEYLYTCYIIKEQYKLRLQKIKEDGEQYV